MKGGEGHVADETAVLLQRHVWAREEGAGVEGGVGRVVRLLVAVMGTDPHQGQRLKVGVTRQQLGQQAPAAVPARVGQLQTLHVNPVCRPLRGHPLHRHHLANRNKS